MKLTEALLRQTLARAGETATPPPELLAHIREAIVEAERRRRLIAAAVVVGSLLLTMLALVLLTTIRT